MNILVYPPVHGFGMSTLFYSTQRALPEHVNWHVAHMNTIPENTISLNAFDFAHFYTLPDVYTSFQNLVAAQRVGLRVIATALYGNPTRYLTEGLALAELPNAGRGAELDAEIRAALLDVERALMRVIYHACDLLIALSSSEADALVTDFGIARERIVIAACGVETRFANATPKLFREKFGLDNFVLCVGRVDANKNQLNLIRALRDENLPLVLAGGSLAPPYLDECKKSQVRIFISCHPFPMRNLVPRTPPRIHTRLSAGSKWSDSSRSKPLLRAVMSSSHANTARAIISAMQVGTVTQATRNQFVSPC